jgi:hypothetical protein
MPKNLLRDFKKLTPKVSLKFVDSTAFDRCRVLDQIDCRELNIVALKALLRAYAKNKIRLHYTIAELEFVLSVATQANLTSDECIDILVAQSGVETNALNVLNELLNCFFKGMPLDIES